MSDHAREIAVSIIQHAFGIHPAAWEHASFDTKLVEYHFFTELYEISLSEEELERHPEAKEFLELFPLDFILMKVQEATRNINFQLCRLAFHDLLEAQPEEDRLYIHRNAIYRMHCLLMKRDFGDFWDSLSSECQGLTKEAEEYVDSQISNSATLQEQKETSVPARIEFDKSFGKGSEASGIVERAKAEFWLNIGYSSGVQDEYGEERFVSLPLGIPLDTQEHLPTNSPNSDYANFQAARNSLLDQIRKEANKLKPGESRLLNLEVKLRRISR